MSIFATYLTNTKMDAKLIIDSLEEALKSTLKALEESGRHVDLNDKAAVRLHNEMDEVWNDILE